jgi:hypothetical protein
MRTADDVKRDPRPGDALLYGPPWQNERIEVMQASAQSIRCRVGGAAIWFPMEKWREWMANAEVLNVAE